MRETTYTPGPWRTNGSLIEVANGMALQVASAYWPKTGNAPRDESEAKSNARLIATAPALLAELKTAVARIELANKEGDPILSAWLPGARAAIAKAEGR